MYIEYKDKKKSNYKLERSTQLKTTGKNLNLKTLYVLTSNSSASASELVINCLRPYMGEKNVVLIGLQTEGKNVGSVTYTNDDKTWEMHPIIGKVYNSEGKSDYENGFLPDYELDEAYEYWNDNTVSILEVLPLGDTNERLLQAALSLIDLNTSNRRRNKMERIGVSIQWKKEE